MATGKGRSAKRSSGTCYSSTTTTIVIFVTLSALLLWLMTSNSFAPPQYSTSRKTPTHIASIAHSHPSKPELHVVDHEDVPFELPDANEIQETKNEGKKVALNDHESIGGESSVENHEIKQDHEDVPAEFPDVSEIQEAKDEAKKATLDHHESIGGESSIENQEMKQENDVPLNDHKAKTDGKIIKEDIDSGKESTEEEKQTSLETQTSEESSVTQKEEIQQMHAEENQSIESHVVKNDGKLDTTKAGKGAKLAENGSEITQNQLSDEDEQQRIEDHQHKEDDQVQQRSKLDPHGAISDDQIQHDEEQPTHSVEDRDSNPHLRNQEVRHDSKDEDRKKKKGKASFSDNSGIPMESKESKRSWSTQADQSENQKERRDAGENNKDSVTGGDTWKLCNVTAGTDYIPCLDNEKVISKIYSRKHHEHRERHCPDEPPTCLVPLPKGYKKHIKWTQSRDKIWYHNVPHTLLAQVKGHQNWVKVVGEFLTFPGGGTQFIHGALHYIDFIQEAVPDIAWGKHSRVVLDVGCGVASFGGFLFDRDVLTMSFAPKDEHEAQVQFALERGIPAISAVMGSQRLPFPSRVFDVVHCARCRVPWHADGGALLLELNRVLRPGGYFVWSATPVYQTLEEDVHIWREMSNLTVAMCWELITIKKEKLNSIGAAIYQKPDSNDCYDRRKEIHPPICKSDDDPNAAWYVPLQSCMHRAPLEDNERGSQWPEEWPERLERQPFWLNKSQMGIYGKPFPDDFSSDSQHWKKLISNSYMNGLGVNWSDVRNVMDMRAVYGGFAAALNDMKVWVMNVVNVDSPDTLPIIYERGLFGIYHDWCESFSTYPRTYDVLHADHLFSRLKKRCKLVMVMAEVDRIVRPGGNLIVRDESRTIGEVEKLLNFLHWKVYFSNKQQGVLSAQKSNWRPHSYVVPS